MRSIVKISALVCALSAALSGCGFKVEHKVKPIDIGKNLDHALEEIVNGTESTSEGFKALAEAVKSNIRQELSRKKDDGELDAFYAPKGTPESYSVFLTSKGDGKTFYLALIEDVYSYMVIDFENLEIL